MTGAPKDLLFECFPLASYPFGFNGKEKDDEVYGAGNEYDFGARIDDARLGRFLSIDKLFKELPNISPYNFAANSPIKGIDFNGYIHIETSDDANNQGVTEETLVRFTHILKNVKSIVENDPDLLEFISLETGYDKNKILSDLTYTKTGDTGPTFLIENNAIVSAQAKSIKTISIDVGAIKALENLDKDDPKYNDYVLAWYMTVLEEYTHVGDRDCNKKNQKDETGQTSGEEGADIPEGKQPMKKAMFKHRGHDVHFFTFGKESSIEPGSGAVTVTETYAKQYQYKNISAKRKSQWQINLSKAKTTNTR